MDLRVQRTRNSIFSAFIEIRASKPLEKITIKELTDKATISKQTFYLHFKDIYDLSEYLEDEAVSSLIKDIPNPEYLVTNTAEAVRQLYQAFVSQGNLFRILFSGNEEDENENLMGMNIAKYNSLSNKIEQKIKELIYELHPEYRLDLDNNIFLTFMIYGSLNTFLKYGNQDTEAVISSISNLIHNIVAVRDK